MPQTGERKQSSTTTPKTESMPATPTNGARKSFFSRFAPPPVDRTNSSTRTAQPARQQSPLSKLILGWMILLVVIEFVSVGLQYADIKWFHLSLEKPWFHTNAFLIGGMSSFFAINLVAIAGAYYLLVRFKLIPRDPFGMRPRTTTQASQTGRSAPDGMGKPRRTRAARRHTTSSVATASSPSTRRVVTKAGTTRAAPPPPAPTDHDDEYYQVKAAQRQLRRREAKR